MGLSVTPHPDLEISKVFIPSKKTIVSIACGWEHTLVLDQAGDVFSSGNGSHGATGQGTKENSYGFKQVLSGAKKISAGRDHSLAIKLNKVYGWGSTE
jgi:alpha-tubulin suppressor-like RCC1 family protein